MHLACPKAELPKWGGGGTTFFLAIPRSNPLTDHLERPFWSYICCGQSLTILPFSRVRSDGVRAPSPSPFLSVACIYSSQTIFTSLLTLVYPAKFVVDGNWVTDHTAPQETDHEGNVNNVLLAKDMSKLEDAGAEAALLSSAAPESTTAQLAAAAPAEDKSVDVTAPGGYPETPAADLEREVSVNPFPASNGAVNPIQLAPGEKIPDEIAAGNINDHVTLDKESYEQSDRIPGASNEVSVKPLPAADGALNPITLAPGEKVPDEVAAGSTTDNVTLDKESYEKSDRLPGDDKEFSVKPLPATEGALNPTKLAPGEKIPEDATAGSITDNVTLDKESYEKSDRLPSGDKEFSVSPLPATEGALNPIRLAPGEPIPKDIVAGSVTDNVTLDKESYEKSDRIPGLETELPPISKNMIPESSLPILGADDVTINTVTPESTTAALARQVPPEPVTAATINTVTPESTTAALASQVPVETGISTISTVTPDSTTAALAAKVPVEPKVPEIVKESQKEANVDPEASAIGEEVKEKAAVEEELLEKVPEVPPAAEGTSGKGTEKSETDKTIVETVAAVAASASVAFAGASIAVKGSASAVAADVADKLPDSVKDVLPSTLQPAAALASTEEPKPAEVATEVPPEVKDSIQAAGEAPEAAANPVAVEEKKEVEAELLRKVDEVNPVEKASPSNKPQESKDEEPQAEPPKAEPVVETAKEVPAVPETNGAKSAPAEAPAAAPAPLAEVEPSSGSKPVDSPVGSSAIAEKKKRNRISAIFSKLKHKIQDHK